MERVGLRNIPYNTPKEDPSILVSGFTYGGKFKFRGKRRQMWLRYYIHSLFKMTWL